MSLSDNTPSNTTTDTQSKTLIHTLADFDQLLTIARSHGVTQLSIGDIAVVIAPPSEPFKSQTPEFKAPVDWDAEAFKTFKNI